MNYEQEQLRNAESEYNDACDLYHGLTELDPGHHDAWLAREQARDWLDTCRDLSGSLSTDDYWN